MTGKTQAHLMRASDGNLYITKFTNNPVGIRGLASEFLATKIGLSLGLPMPEVAVIDVPNLLIKHTPELRIKPERGRAIPCASGQQLAVRYVADLWQDRVFDYLPKTRFGRVINRQDFARILPLDKWLGNCDDRQAVYVARAGNRQYHAMFIDQHDCFDGANWGFPDKAIMGTHYGKHVYRCVTGWDSFEPMLTRAEELDCADLWRLASEVPREWYEQDVASLSRLIETLHRRRSVIRDLITQFRNCPRNPFPYWTARDGVQVQQSGLSRS